MTQQEKNLKAMLTFKREVIDAAGKPMIKISARHNAIYRQMLFAYYNGEDTKERDEAVKDLLTISIHTALRSKI